MEHLNFCYQAITLINPRPRVNKCKRDLTPTDPRDVTNRLAFIGLVELPAENYPSQTASSTDLPAAARGHERFSYLTCRLLSPISDFFDRGKRLFYSASDGLGSNSRVVEGIRPDRKSQREDKNMSRIKSLLFLLALAAQGSLASATVTYVVGTCKNSNNTITSITQALQTAPRPNAWRSAPAITSSKS